MWNRIFVLISCISYLQECVSSESSTESVKQKEDNKSVNPGLDEQLLQAAENGDAH